MANRRASSFASARPACRRLPIRTRSDGIPESTDVHRAIFSHERLQQTLQRAGSGSPVGIVRAVVRAIDEFSADTAQSDDITAFAFALEAVS